MRHTGTPRWCTPDLPDPMPISAIVIGHGEVERTSRYVGVRSVTIICRCATRSGDVYRSRPTKTADGIMRLAGTQRSEVAAGAGQMSYAVVLIGHGEVEKNSRLV